MLLLKRGNKLPTVALMQRLLNRVLGCALNVDGDFGNDTDIAIRDFQQKERITIDGIMGPDSWRILSRSFRHNIIDHVDAADDYLSTPDYIGYQRDLLRVGASPIVSFHESNGIQSVSNLIRAAGQNGRVVLLRFHGHGSPGSMGLTVGRGGIEHVHAGTASLFSLEWLKIQQYFGSMYRIFHPMGSVELHGCNVAGEVYQRGRRIQSTSGVGVGPYLLQRLAHLLNVPITASPNTQYSHGSAILPFEGRTITVCPDGSRNIEGWARNKTIY